MRKELKPVEVKPNIMVLRKAVQREFASHLDRDPTHRAASLLACSGVAAFIDDELHRVAKDEIARHLANADVDKAKQVVERLLGKLETAAAEMEDHLQSCEK